MDVNNFKVTIYDKFHEYLNCVKVFQREILEDFSDVAKNRQMIISLKDKDEKLQASDIKPILVDIQLKNYEAGLKEMDLKANFLRPLIEYKNLADLFKVELNLTDLDKQFMEGVFSGPSTAMYIVDRNKLVAKEVEEHSLFIDKARTIVSKEGFLNHVFKNLTENVEETKE